MKKLAKIVIALGILSSSVIAQNSINAMRVPGNVSNIGPSSKAWLSASYKDIVLYPQTTIKMNDKDANALNANNYAKKARIKTLYDGKNISFLIKWSDDTKSIQEGYSSTTYGDGFALQFPTLIKDVNELPYIGMGSEGRSVVVHLKKATGITYEPNGNGKVYTQVNENNQNVFSEDLQKYRDEVIEEGMSDYQRVFISEGFGSMTQVKDNSITGKMQMEYKNGFWSGTLSRQLKSDYLDLDIGAFPIAFALWDGDKKNRDGLKLISSWVGVKLVGKNGGNELLNALNEKAKGDILNGEKVALENCTACHRYNNENSAPEFMAPNLSNIGGYSIKEYLMESIVKPNAVVLAGYNTTAHSNFEWYSLGEKGERISTMPSYDWIDEKSRNDLVAYFMSLKAEVK